MKPLKITRDVAALASRRGPSPATLLAAALLIGCAHVFARGQDSAPTTPPAGAERAAPAADARVKIEPAGPPPPTKDAPAAPHAEGPRAAAEDVAIEFEQPPPAAPADADALPEDSDSVAASVEIKRGSRWKAATEQTLLFLGVQHGYAFTQPKTRRDLAGPFFRDYFRSVGSIGGWEDGGKFFTNYVAHPMQGALLGFVWVQNDPEGESARFGRSEAYWRSRAKALAWSAVWSTQFEIGPVSQASIGNVGLHGKQTWVDIVITPTVGTAWLVAEDALDRFVVRRIERRVDNLLLRIAARVLLNPTRSSANLLRFERPWRRDR